MVWSYEYRDKPRPCYRITDGSDDGDVAECWDEDIAKAICAKMNGTGLYVEAKGHHCRRAGTGCRIRLDDCVCACGGCIYARAKAILDGIPRKTCTACGSPEHEDCGQQ